MFSNNVIKAPLERGSGSSSYCHSDKFLKNDLSIHFTRSLYDKQFSFTQKHVKTLNGYNLNDHQQLQSNYFEMHYQIPFEQVIFET